MIRLLYQIHRWVGLALALFMVLWFFSGLVIVYGGTLPQSRGQQLAHGETLASEPGWLSLGEAWQRSAEARKAQDKGEGAIASARLVRIGGEADWVVEDSRGRRFALSAIDGHLQSISPEQAQRIAQQWLSSEHAGSSAPLPAVSYLDSLDETSSLRNYQDYKPFLRIGVDDGAGTELLISAATGDVLQAATRFDRGLYLTGNWLHFFRVFDGVGGPDTRRNVLLWSVAFAAVATLSGLIIGWLRWRPGYFGKPTYPQGRTQPYRTFWLRWHFWSGLIGGTLALLWTISGVLGNNPWQVFSAAAANRQELARFQGRDLPSVVKNWQPGSLPVGAEVVELTWRRVGDQAVLLSYSRDGDRQAQVIDGTVAQFDEPVLVAASQRLLGGDTKVASHGLQQSYDSYYYPTHRQSEIEKPLPVLRVDLADAGETHLYLDPQDGRVLLKQDSSRRVYRWLFSAVHFWDFGPLYSRPLWDAWSVTWIGFGLVLSVSSVVLGWRRLRRTVRGWREREETEALPELATASSSES